MRQEFFGAEASTAWNVRRLTDELGAAYTHHSIDIRDRDALARSSPGTAATSPW